MLKVISRWASALRAVGARRRRKLADREIAVIGSSEAACLRVVEALSVGSQRGSVNFANPAGPDKVDGTASEAPETQPAGSKTFRMIHLPPNGRSRARWWAVTVPPWNPRTRSPEEGDWVLQCDTMVICVPYGQVATAGGRAEYLEDGFPFIVGRARNCGRLRRVAVLLEGIPAESAPQHASQVVCQIPRHSGLSEHLSLMVNAVRSQPGEGLADPEWGRFLSNVIGADSNLAVLVDLVQRASGRGCGMAFMGDRTAPRLDAAPLRQWIDGRRRQPRGPGERWANGILGATATVFLACLVLWMSSPGVSRSVDASGDNRPPGVLKPVLKDAIATYDTLPVRIAAPGLSSGRSVAELRTALARILGVLRSEELIAWQDTKARECREQIQATFTALEGAGRAERMTLSAQLGHFVGRQLEDHASWKREVSPGPLDPSVGKPWIDCLEQAEELVLLLSLRLEGEGLDRFGMDADAREDALGELRGVGRLSQAERLEALLSSPRRSQFYANYRLQMNVFQSEGNDLFVRFARFLPSTEPFMEIEGNVTGDITQDGTVTLQVQKVYGLMGHVPVDLKGEPSVVCPASGVKADKISITPGDSFRLDWKIVEQPAGAGWKRGRGGVATLSVPSEGWTMACGNILVRVYGMLVTKDGLTASLRREGAPATGRFGPGQPARPPEPTWIRLSWTRDWSQSSSTMVASAGTVEGGAR